MERLIKVAIVLLISKISFGQENDTSDKGKFRFRSIEAGFGFYESTYKERINSSGHSGIDLSVRTSFSLKRNIFSLDLKLGEEVSFFGGGDSFYTVNLLYGRQWDLAAWFAIETHSGLGVFSNSRYDLSGDFGRDTKTEESLGVPIDLKFMLYPKGFTIGLNPGVNFNSIGNTFYGNLIFQYNFN
ncbi:hypothetical protein [Aquimarina sp. 433]